MAAGIWRDAFPLHNNCAIRADVPSSSEGKQHYYSGSYALHVLDGVGHFPTREAGPKVGELVRQFLRAPQG